MRLAARIQRKAQTAAAAEESVDTLCDSCANVSNCGILVPYLSTDQCDGYYNVDDAQADAELRSQQEEAERQAAEEEATDAQQNRSYPVVAEGPDNTPADGPADYQCGSCGKKYKTLRGLQNHGPKCGGE
jgi:hypothetical protein